MIEFHLDNHSGVVPYLQPVHQVKQALRLGLLEVGDQLPTVREVVAQITINPNTVLKASCASAWCAGWQAPMKPGWTAKVCWRI